MTPIKRECDKFSSEEQQIDKKPKLTKKEQKINEIAFQELNHDSISTLKQFKNIRLCVEGADGDKQYEYLIDLRKIKKASPAFYQCLKKNKDIQKIKKENKSTKDATSPKFSPREITTDLIITSIEQAGLPFDKLKISAMLPQVLEFFETGNISLDDQNVVDLCLLADFLNFEELEQFTIEYMKKQTANPSSTLFPSIDIENDYLKSRVYNEIIEYLIELVLYDKKKQRSENGPLFFEKDLLFISSKKSFYREITLKLNPSVVECQNREIRFSSFFEKLTTILHELTNITTINFEIQKESIEEEPSSVTLLKWAYYQGEEDFHKNNIKQSLKILTSLLEKSKLQSLKNLSFSAYPTKFGYSETFNEKNKKKLLNFLDLFLKTNKRKLESLRIDFDDYWNHNKKSDFDNMILKLHNCTDRLLLGVPF